MSSKRENKFYCSTVHFFAESLQFINQRMHI